MCGVVGILTNQPKSRPNPVPQHANSAYEVFLGLTTLQHRGQDAAGILSYDETGFHQTKNIGLVESVFTRENMERLTGDYAIGHARYSTIGRGELEDVQPFLRSYPYGIGLVHNGNIVNCAELEAELRTQDRRHLLTRSDSEVVLNLFAEGLARFVSQKDLDHPDFERICYATSEVMRRAIGSFSVVALIAGQGLVAFRDPLGIRPLVWGKRTNPDGSVSHLFASESVALSFLGFEEFRDLRPGEVVFVDTAGQAWSRTVAEKQPRHCMFEWIYFASPESIIDGIPVYGARIQLGRNLASFVKDEMKRRGLQADLVVPVPETSRIAAIALAEDLGIPYREVLIKNRYIKRTFILNSQEKRQKAVNLKLSPVRSEIQGKSVLLVDDSIVRGTTSRKIVELVRKAGASNVIFVSTCPPIQHPCFYGIDFPERSELIASGRSNPQIEDELGVDAVFFQGLEGLKKAVPIPLCTACIDGCYPTDVSSGEGFSKSRKADRK